MSFHLSSPASVLLPVLFRKGGGWRVATSTELAVSGQIKNHFEGILEEGGFDSLAEFWERKLNFRSKLSKQVIDSNSWLVVHPAGGEIPVAAYVRVKDLGPEPPIIDQTLYWMTVDSEDEAVYLTGLINSDSLPKLIDSFIPEGAFGGRHLHTLPLQAIPPYDPTLREHKLVVSATKTLMIELDQYRRRASHSKFFEPQLSLPARRTKIRQLLATLEAKEPYEAACLGVYT